MWTLIDSKKKKKNQSFNLSKFTLYVSSKCCISKYYMYEFQMMNHYKVLSEPWSRVNETPNVAIRLAYDSKFDKLEYETHLVFLNGN